MLKPWESIPNRIDCGIESYWMSPVNHHDYSCGVPYTFERWATGFRVHALLSKAFWVKKIRRALQKVGWSERWICAVTGDTADA